jgi:signal transduction histidine kinase/CheY-like chemotaxis protein/purine-cytosine permease-like protein
MTQSKPCANRGEARHLVPWPLAKIGQGRLEWHASCSARHVESESPRPPVQRIVKVRRDYNTWVASETMEDYALRYTPQRFRRWSPWRVANTALGVASFLILEAVGATLLVQFGFWNAFWAIIATGVLIFVAGTPISVYAARYGVDMDLLTRGAGFGYIGSTLTSLIYACFTFIFFALEAAVMAYALQMGLGIPPVWGYLLCALVVVPLVTHGVTVISRFQVWTQPLWLVMMVVPLAAVVLAEPGALASLVHYGGADGGQAAFDWLRFGAALTVGMALMTQMGEQADYLRFMPPPCPGRAWRWWAAVLAGGPGWVLIGVLKMLAGMLLAHVLLTQGVAPQRAVDPNQMYLAAYEYLLPRGWAVAATVLFVVVSQLKINVTNAYAGSLAWSNFFSRLTHSHPGRVVWVIFNILIALLLMQMNVFEALGEVLGLYSNIAIAWLMTVVADLVINKPLGWSPSSIEFKRAHLYDVNPVGVGAMALASLLSIAAYLGLFGAAAQAFSAVVAMATALLTAPLIAWFTRGRYARARGAPVPSAAGFEAHAQEPGQRRCVICERLYEEPDMAHCPAYQGDICSLCCSLDARCGDRCKPQARLHEQWLALLRVLLPRGMEPYLKAGLAHYLLIMLIMAPVLALALAVVYRYQASGLAARSQTADLPMLDAALRVGYLQVYAVLLLIAGTLAWWLVLAHQSREVAQEESDRQTQLLMQEIENHRRTDEALQQARWAAEQANRAKTRYLSAISHELRTPLNSILGYAQLLQEDADMPAHRAHAIRVIRRAGEHVLSLIEDSLDIARIEAGKLSLDVRPVRFADWLAEVAGLFELQARAKGLRFVFETHGELPAGVRADEKRLRQILINLLANAVKYTHAGEVRWVVRYARQMACFEVHDTGPGIAPQELQRVFEPFSRGHGVVGEAVGSGTGLGLTIARMLTDLMGGELTVRSEPGRGSVFTVRLFLPALSAEALPPARPSRTVLGYLGARRCVLVVDNEESDRELLRHWLQPLGFEVLLAASGQEALALLQGRQPGGDHGPHAIFMDLAMPGIDGWETLRRLRAMGWDSVPTAVVSANAFDKALATVAPSRAGDEAEDRLRAQAFFVKPVRRDELLAWLGQRLGLQWRHAAVSPAREIATTAGAAAVAGCPLSADEAAALLALVRLGYVRGVVQWLDRWLVHHPQQAPWVAEMQALARAFRFDAIEQHLTA